MSEWISIEDWLPSQGVVVALLNTEQYMNAPDAAQEYTNWHGAGYLSEFGRKYWTVFGENRGMTLDSVTHWMPLPGPPTETDQ